MSWFSRAANVFRSDRVDRALDEEATFHIESRVEDLVAAGMTREAAEAMARRQYGNRLRLRESSRDIKLLPWLDDLVQDVRHGLRALRRTPTFTSVAILTVALGIGANTAIFSIVNGVLLRPLAYPRPEQLMYLTTNGPREEFPVSVAEYLEFQQFNRSFSDVGAFRAGEANLAAGDRAVRVRSAIVDEHLLNALGLQPAEGRLFRTEDSVVSAPPLPVASAVAGPVVLISYELWESAFGARPIVGRSIEVDGRRLEVVGVMARGSDLMDTHTDIWLPLGFTEDERLARNNHNLLMIGRLSDGVTIASAETELTALIEAWAARAGITPGGAGHAGHVLFPPGPNRRGHGLTMTPLVDQVLGSAGRMIWVLQAAVGLVLLIACANVANLLLARAEMRRREFAVLAALGAARGRLIRKALTESVMLAVAGGVLGVLLARTGVDIFVRVYPTSLPRIGEVAVDQRVMLVSFAAAIVCGLLFGLAPVMRTRSDATAEALKSRPFGSEGASRHRVRHALVMAETALAVIVVVSAGLLLRTVQNLTAVDVGFNRTRVATFSITLPRASFNNLDRVRAYQRVLDQLRTVPGIVGASAMTSLPLDRPFVVNGTEMTDSPAAPGTIAIDYQRVMSDFFETTGVPILQGRAFQRADAASEGDVAVINETLANTYWNGQNPIGRRLRPGGTTPWFTVVGVAKDVKQTAVDQPVGAEAYVLIEQTATDTITSFLSFSPTTVHIVVRTRSPLVTLAPTMTRVVHEVVPEVPVARLREMDAVFSESIRRQRLLAHLLTLFSGLALLLAAIGTYGVLASMVAERRRDIGIRLALGANRGRLLGQVMTQGLVLAGTGIVVGLAGALGLGRLLRSLLFDVQPADVITLAVVIPSIVTVAALASWMPAWRASRLDPNVVLKAE
jgi:putative ABC transport system permease protein